MLKITINDGSQRYSLRVTASLSESQQIEDQIKRENPLAVVLAIEEEKIHTRSKSNAVRFRAHVSTS